MDSVSEARLTMVNPQLAAKVRTMAAMLEQEKIYLRVTQGIRSWDEQARLYAQGRTAPGKIVTDAEPGSSWHNFGLAVDLVPSTQIPILPDWNRDHPDWQRMLAVGESVGLVEGALWRTFKDWPHFQLSGTWPVSPNDEARQVFKDGGMQAVWEQGGLA